MSSEKIYAMIPARLGSTRLKMKNLALINGKPMISYAIEAALGSGVFDRTVLNSENEIFREISERHGCDFYRRPEELGSSATKSDEVVDDFMQHFPDSDVVAWINPIAPFQTGDEVREIIEFFLTEKLDSLITVENKQVHCMFNDEPINYSVEGLFAQTQDLVPVQPFVYSIMMWRNKVFLKQYKDRGHALFCGKFGVFPVRKRTEIIIKNQEDLMLADLLMRVMEGGTNKYRLRYDHLSGLEE